MSFGNPFTDATTPMIRQEMTTSFMKYLPYLSPGDCYCLRTHYLCGQTNEPVLYLTVRRGRPCRPCEVKVYFSTKPTICTFPQGSPLKYVNGIHVNGDMGLVNNTTRIAGLFGDRDVKVNFMMGTTLKPGITSVQITPQDDSLCGSSDDDEPPGCCPDNMCVFFATRLPSCACDDDDDIR